jgi:Putative zinc- or iron-chelating domain
MGCSGDCHATAASETPGQLRGHFGRQDAGFIALVDGAFRSAARRSGSHLLCRPGCAQCCTGVFAVGPADGLRLTQAWTQLLVSDPERAARIRERAQIAWGRLAAEFPGDRRTGILDDAREAEFELHGNDEVCPVLDPELQTCDLYAARPHTCRVFGPPVERGGGYAVCELCFTQATAE